MKKILFLFFVYPSLTFSQESPTDFLKNLCNHEIEGISNLDNIKINISIPCTWEKRKEGNYGYRSDVFLLSIGNIIKVLKFDKGFSIEEKSELTIKQLLNIGKAEKKKLSAKKVILNGDSAMEYVIKKSENVTNYFLNGYNIYYFIKLNDKLIISDYQVSSVNEKMLNKEQDEYFKMFRQLASKLSVSKK
ncbi:MAG: hypothetical protein JNK14_09410 [Chitinophagaceae bacterium]|nr:hypothetical protein [Chitinophagaceae bacterium]